MNNIKDRIRGSLIGGAAGDALGYKVEFMGEHEIFARYGAGGIREYDPCPKTGKALISDDTQMTMFTAAGLLTAEYYKTVFHGESRTYRFCVKNAYIDWLKTQEYDSPEDCKKHTMYLDTWIIEGPELYSRRAPGNTCLSSIIYRMNNFLYETGNYLSNIVNYSKGCGAVMRAAPVGMLKTDDIDALDMESAEIGAITHGHPLGYIPAAMLSHMVNRLVYSDEAEKNGLAGVITEARDAVARLFAGNEYIDEFIALINCAMQLAANDAEDLSNIHRLGEGWVGDEALAIAVYCCLRHPDSFSDAIVAAVNHRGDSDSTGAIAGNIMGAYLGYEAIDDKWKQKLELSDIILELADDMTEGFRDDDEWKRKYYI